MRMTCNVYVLTEGGSPQLLEAGSVPPEWALPQLGAHALTEADESDEADEESDGADDTTEEEADESPQIPPVKGKGSSAKAWAAYALAHGFEVEEDAKASEIREALADAGIPVQ